jgi:hypothetical protein
MCAYRHGLDVQARAGILAPRDPLWFLHKNIVGVYDERLAIV